MLLELFISIVALLLLNGLSSSTVVAKMCRGVEASVITRRRMSE